MVPLRVSKNNSKTPMSAFASHPAKPSSDQYDTLDELDDSHASSIKQLYSSVFGGVQRYAGIVISGSSTLSDASMGYWGRAFALESGEYMQIRVCPKGSMGKPLAEDSTRVIAVRRSGLNCQAHTACAIIFQPRACPTMATQLSCGKTTGCRGLHILLPSLFSKHTSVRDKDAGHASIDLRGFHSVRPYSFTITNKLKCEGKKINTSTSVAPGLAYVTLAAQLAGIDMADPLVRSHVEITDDKYRSQVGSMISKISRSAGESSASDALSSALTIMEVLSVEGVLSILSHAFFEGVLPDTVHAPGGLPLLIVAACRIAIFYDSYGLPPPTAVDAAANSELRILFETRWKAVANGSFAIDLAMKSGNDNANARLSETPGMKPHYADNLIFWQRVGQRIITKAFSDVSHERKNTARMCAHTRFGPAELLMDPLSDAKYAWLEKLEFMQPLAEAPVNKITFATLAEVRLQLIRMHDLVENWLRTGFYGEVCLNRPNVNIGVRQPKKCARYGTEECDCIGSCSSSSDDGDDVLDNRVCVDALEQAATSISIAFLHGGFAVHNFGIQTFLAGDRITNTCADCDARVDVLQGVLFANAASTCALCDRPRCFKCSTRSLAKPRQQSCLRCSNAPAVKTTGRKKK